MPPFSIVNLIEKKRKGHELSAEEIEYFVKCVSNFSDDPNIELADPAQIGAMLMAIYLTNFTVEETHALTKCMEKSGKVFTWPEEYKDFVVDKHSTGGVGDKVSLVLAPALAAVGLKVPMISGRSLGHTGGTLNKLESIPGYRTDLSAEDIQRQLENVGCCIVGQTEDIVPADRVLYRCRDLTATVGHTSLITASIVSKKLAEGISAIVYDVKFGKGALIEQKNQAEKLAEMLVLSSAPAKCSAFLTAMDFPLGTRIGNSLEVMEAVECLRGESSDDVMEIVETLGAELLYLTKKVEDREAARDIISEVCNNGSALKKFEEMIIAQGVDTKDAAELCYGEMWSVLKPSMHTTDIIYDGPTGYVQEIDANFLGRFCKEHLSSHPSNGLTIEKHVGHCISTGDVWLIVHHQKKLPEECIESLRQSIKIGEENTKNRKRVYERITSTEKNKIAIDDLMSTAEN